MRIILYQAKQWEVGGIETFNLNFCKRLGKYYDILFLCDEIEPKAFERLSQYVKVAKFEEQYFETDVCIFSSAWGSRPVEYIKADRYIQMVHADYSGIQKHWNFNYKKLDEVTEHIGGGENIAKTFKECTGYDCKVIPYLLDDEVEIKPVLHLISTTRIGKEKGMERMVIMAKKLKELGYKFNWDVWGDSFDDGYVKRIRKMVESVPELSFRGAGRDLASYVADADYLVQLSDTEGYCFAMYEALSYNTPVIATDFPNAHEQIGKDKGYILPFELFTQGTDKEWKVLFEKLYKKIPKFEFEPLVTEEDWIKELGETGKRRKVKVTEPVKNMVKCIRGYNDIQLARRIKQGEVFEVSKTRAKYLQSLKLVNILENFNGEVSSSKKR